MISRIHSWRIRMEILRVPLVAFVLLALLPAVAVAQAAPAARTAPAPGQVLTIDECIAVALEAQPTIQATLYDYAAARARVREAFAPLLPQLSGSVTATRSNSTIVPPTLTTTGRTVTAQVSRQFSDTFLAQVQL